MPGNRTFSTDTSSSGPESVYTLSQFPHPPIPRPGTAGPPAAETSYAHAGGLGLVPGSVRGAAAAASSSVGQLPSQRIAHLHRTASTPGSRPPSIPTLAEQPPPLPPPQAPLPTPPPLRSKPGPSHLAGFPPASTSPDTLHDQFDRVRIGSDLRHDSFLDTSSTLTTSPRTSAWVSDQSTSADPPPPPPPHQQSGRVVHPARTSSSAAARGAHHPVSAAHRSAMATTADSPILHDRAFLARSSVHYHAPPPPHNNNHDHPSTNRASSGSFYDEPAAISPTTTNRGSLFSNHTSASTSSVFSHTGMPGDKDPASFHGGLTTVGEVDDGLMLADEGPSVSDPAATWSHNRTVSSVSTTVPGAAAALASQRRPDCLIGPKSSFHQLKGFCTGAEAFRKSGHVEGMKKAPSYGMNTTVGRCTTCEYYHVYSDIARDLARDVHANQMKFNMFYRVRFMYKSHMLVKSLSEIRYACIFCTHIGHTVREGDATVFLSQEQLLRHLSRHPQPLPEVPGVTILYGQVGQGHHLEEDYDLHFPDPPAPMPMPETTFSTLPTATAVKAHVRKPGDIKPPTDPDGSENILQFLPGARIVGVEFPAKWGGSWCVGWHDGVRAAFPFKYVELDLPKPADVSYNANSSVSVKARWKWSPKLNKDEPRWLPLDKGDTIRNVGWIYQDHWCWSGTNSKGKTGVFPASHIDPESVLGMTAATAASNPPSVRSSTTSSGQSLVEQSSSEQPAKQSSGIRGLMSRRAIHKTKDPSLTWDGVAAQSKFPAQPQVRGL